MRQSVVGRELGRPARTPTRLKVISASFVAIAVALLVLPHDVGAAHLVADALTSDAPQHARAAVGAALVALGTAGLLVGWGLPNEDAS